MQIGRLGRATQAQVMVMKDEIEISGYDLTATMERNRQRRSEVSQSAGLGELSGMLLPLSVALARLTARCDVREAA